MQRPAASPPPPREQNTPCGSPREAPKRRSDEGVAIDRSAPVCFLRAACAPNDSVGVLLKTYRTGQVIQRIVPVTTAAGDRFQAWLRHLNSRGWNVYVGVNSYRPGR